MYVYICIRVIFLCMFFWGCPWQQPICVCYKKWLFFTNTFFFTFFVLVFVGFSFLFFKLLGCPCVCDDCVCDRVHVYSHYHYEVRLYKSDMQVNVVNNTLNFIYSIFFIYQFVRFYLLNLVFLSSVDYTIRKRQSDIQLRR